MLKLKYGGFFDFHDVFRLIACSLIDLLRLPGSLPFDPRVCVGDCLCFLLERACILEPVRSAIRRDFLQGRI
jgi:hypothetical protein